MPDSSSCSIFGKINNGMIRTELRILVKKYCSVEDHLGFVFFGGVNPICFGSRGAESSYRSQRCG